MLDELGLQTITPSWVSVMTKPRKLSRSACAKWMACPASFDYYYNQKIEPINKGSALMFGNGMDSALNLLLSAVQSPHLEPIKTPMEAFRESIAEVELGTVIYGKYDFDVELLSEEVLTELLLKLNKVGYPGNDPIALFEALKTKQANKEPLTPNQEKALDLIYRAVFEVKADLMIEAYIEKVLPKIKQVYDVQKRSGPGYLDAIVQWDGYGKIILDNKTSGQPYPDDAVEYSDQLAMYSAEEKVSQVAFVVLIKEINKNRKKICSVCGHNGTGKRHARCDAKATVAHAYQELFVDERNHGHESLITINVKVGDKRCNGEWKETVLPKAEIQIIHGEVTPEMMAVAAELQESVGRGVEASIFPCNVNQCNNQYGKPCEYKNLKWKGSMEGLRIRKSK